jgi:hypothetical protein
VTDRGCTLSSVSLLGRTSKVQKLGKSYEQILKELLSKNPQKLDKALKDLQKLKELLEKLGMKPSDYLEP